MATHSVDTASSGSSVHIVDNRGVRYSIDKAEIDYSQLVDLFNRNAFWAQQRRASDLELAVSFSHPVVSVWEGSRLIAFGRATSDGVYRAVIWDIVVDCDYRRQGIGRKLVETLITHPHVQSAERIYLFTTHQQEFYQRIGFVENASTTMVLMNKTIEFVTPAGLVS